MKGLANSRIQVHLDFGTSTPILLGECLWYAGQGVTAFQWSEQALALPFKLSPLHLPRQKAVILAKHEPFNGLHGLFSDSIPDGFGLRLMNNAFTTNGYALNSVTPVHRLAWVGSRGIGALTYSPVLGPSESRELIEISELGAYAQNADIDRFEDISVSALRAGGSAHGARPKFWASVHKDGKSIILGDGIPTQKDFTQCLVKFAPADGDVNEPYLEAACLQLASDHGLRAVKARLLQYSNGVGLAVERFDRSPGGGRTLTQSLAAILNNNFRIPSLDYDHIYQVSKVLSGEPESERIYRQACFNVSLSMRDDHSKNFAFLMDATGKWELSPAYDLCPCEGPSGWQTMSVSGHAQSIERGHLLQFAQRMGLPLSVATDGLDQAISAANQFESLAISLGAQASAAKKWSKSFAAIEKHLRAPSSSVSGLKEKLSAGPEQKLVEAEICAKCKSAPCTCAGAGGGQSPIERQRG